MNKMKNTVIEMPNMVVEIPDSTLPDPDHISYYVLEKDRKIYIDYEIGCELLTCQRMIMRWNMEDRGKPVEERKPITLYIMSYGGDVDYMWSFIDTVMTSKTPVVTVNMGVCASAASLIFLSADTRYMMPRAKVVVHEGSAQLSGDAVKVMDASESYKKTLKQMKQFILERTNIPAASLNRKRNNDWELDAAYCLENGVCTKIIDSLDEVI